MTDQTVSADAVEAVARALMVGVFGDDALIAFDPPEDAPQYMKDAAAKRCERARRDACAAIAALDAHRATSLPDEVRGLVERLRITGPTERKAADALTAEHAARVRAEAEAAALREAAHTDTQISDMLEATLKKAEAELAEARAALEEIANTPVNKCKGYMRCTDKFVSHRVVDIARAALAKAAEQTANT